MYLHSTEPANLSKGRDAKLKGLHHFVDSNEMVASQLPKEGLHHDHVKCGHQRGRYFLSGDFVLHLWNSTVRVVAYSCSRHSHTYNSPTWTCNVVATI